MPKTYIYILFFCSVVILYNIKDFFYFTLLHFNAIKTRLLKPQFKQVPFNK